MKQLTVNDLLKYAKEQVKKGNGDKLIITADDVEGNGYHGLFYGFSDGTLVNECIKYSNGVSDSETDDSTKLVVLG